CPRWRRTASERAGLYSTTERRTRAAEDRARAAPQGSMSMEKPPRTSLLAGPRGFCAGVERAVPIVERALPRFGAPVYVRPEIVHTRYVVDRLESQGPIF